MLHESDLHSMLMDLTSMLTPPTSAQIASALSYLHLYRLIKIHVRNPKFLKKDGLVHDYCKKIKGGSASSSDATHFAMVDYAKLANEKTSTIKTLLTGEMTRLGSEVINMHKMRALRMSLPNTLLMLAGMLFDNLTECSALASIYEISKDSTDTLWKEDDVSALRKAVKRYVQHSNEPKTLVNIYFNVRKDKTLESSLAHRTWTNIDRLAKQIRMSARAYMNSDSWHPELLQPLSPLLNDKTLEKYSKLEKCLLASRIHNLCSINASKKSIVATSYMQPVPKICHPQPLFNESALALKRQVTGNKPVFFLYESMILMYHDKNPRVTTLVVLPELPCMFL